MSHYSLTIPTGREVWFPCLFHHRPADECFFFLSSRPASTSSSTSSSLAGSSHWPQEARMRRSSESASTSSSCPSASSSRRKTKAPVRLPKHRCVSRRVRLKSSVSLNVQICILLLYVFCLRGGGGSVNAVVKGEKVSVIVFHAARGWVIRIKNVCCNFTISAGGSAGRGGRLHGSPTNKPKQTSERCRR